MLVSVIGTGSIGLRHVVTLLALGHRVEVYDPDASAIARACAAGARPGRHLEDSEAVFICTPVGEHAAAARTVLATGRSPALFVEKPLAPSVEAAAVFARWAHPVTQVGYNLRFHPDVQKMRQLLPDPTTGQFFLDCDASAWPGHAYGSMLLECSHEIDLALSFGAPAIVDAAHGTDDAHERTLWLGRQWHIALRDRMSPYHRQWTILKRGVEASRFFYAPEELGVEMYRLEVAHFMQCVQRHTPTACPFSSGLAVLDVCAQVEALVGGTS